MTLFTSKLILVLSVAYLCLASAHLDRTKGLRTRVLQEEVTTFTGKNGVDKEKKDKNGKQSEALDEEETSYAKNKDGEPISVSVTAPQEEGFWNFADPDPEDDPSELSESPPPVETTEAADETLGDRMVTFANQTATGIVTLLELVGLDVSEINEQDVTTELTEANNMDVDTSKQETAVLVNVETEPPMDGAYPADTAGLQLAESDLISYNVTSPIPAQNELEAKLVETQLQVNTLNQTVKDLEVQLDWAMKTIATQEQIINTLTAAVSGSNNQGSEAPEYITSLEQDAKSLP